MRVFLLISLITWSFGTQAQYSEKVQKATDHQTLERLSRQFAAEFKADSLRAQLYLDKNNLPKIEYGENGYMRELIGINEAGEFIYFETENRRSRETIGTDQAGAAAPSGYGLEGDNMHVGVWDGGRVRPTHQEFGNRAIQMDGQTNNSNHATHVAGTMAASGRRADAKGMAPKAMIDAYDWSQNTSEMPSAASNGLLVSNHSYGTVTGWNGSGSSAQWTGNTNISSTEDYRFGFYGNSARAFDQIAFAAPYFLIVKSAGNDRNQGPSFAGTSGNPNPDPNYGSVSSYSMAKNILVVGAVNGINGGYLSPAQVQVSGFTCFGPTDDGRIRPDVVAKGVSVLSSGRNSDTHYYSASGTSMAAPAVTGSSILLQEHYQNLHGNGNFMRSATLKALIIHTADEAGTSPGPDYRHGWGLMNTKKAADLISDTLSYILEENLTENTSKSYKVAVDQQQDVRLTLCWADPAHNALSASLNPTTLVLINDLDIRLRSTTSGTTYQPYVLNPGSPASGATNGDNFRDNVEQIYVNNLPAGVYTIEIGHKGASLTNGQQDFSLIAEGVGILPEVNFSVQQERICIGASSQLIGITSNDVSSYQWKSNDPNLQFSNPNARISQVSSNVPGNYDITLVAYNNRGKDSASVSAAINIYTNPDVQIDSTGIYCLPDQNVKTIGANLGGGTWTGGLWMPFTDTVLFVPSSVGAGDYQLIYVAQDQNGCTGRDTVTVQLREGPEVSLDSLESYCNISNDFDLNGGSPAGGKFFVNGVEDSLVRPSALGPGVHRVTYQYVDSNACIASVERLFEIRNCNSIEENDNSSILMYPNPANDVITIQADQIIEQLQILDFRGRMILSLNPNSQRLSLDISELEKAVYFVRVNGMSQRLIKSE